MAKLTSAARKRLPGSAFVFPNTRKYPIADASHARNALSRAAAQGGSVVSAVRAAVHRRYPEIGGGSTLHQTMQKGRPA